MAETQPKETAEQKAARRAELRASALLEKQASARAAGYDPEKYDGKTAAELEKLSYEKQGAPRAERLAIRLALDRALATQSVAARGLSEDERAVIVRAESLKAKAKSK